jgi:GT2 family glycosyltransferase
MIRSALDLALVLTALPLLLAAGYLALLAALSRRSAPAEPGGAWMRFDLVVPAHDEERGIAATVASLSLVRWPALQRRIVVVADNCTDQTAERAAAAGARVLVRRDADHQGKGHALAHAFQSCLADGFADALVVVDADTLVAPDLPQAFASRLAAGALAIQADYRVRNPEESWRTQLMSLAFTLFHRVRSLGRERLGLSCGLRGNGMCLSTRLLREVPWDAFSLVEDVEYGLRLGEADVRVWYADEGRVFGEMVSSGPASSSQRRRWEDGRRSLARRRAWPLLAEAWRRRSVVVADLAVDLLVPPLAPLFAAAVLVAASGAALRLEAGASLAMMCVSISPSVMLLAYVLRGYQLSGSGLAGLGAMAHAPGYLAWKLWARATGSRTTGRWVRTPRAEEHP